MDLKNAYIILIISLALLVITTIEIIMPIYFINHYILLKRPGGVRIRQLNLPKYKSCRFCGENRDYYRDFRNGVEYVKYEWFSGIFRIRKCSKDVFICYNCKAEWQENYTSEMIKRKIIKNERKTNNG